MSEKILIVTDNSKARWLKRFSGRKGYRCRDVSILTLGITPEYFIKTNFHRSELFNNFRFIDAKDIPEDTQRRVGEFYIDFIFKFPEKVGKELFIHNGRNLWWFLDFSEKCPVRSKIINRLFYLELVQCITKDNDFDRIYIDLDDYVLSRVFVGLKEYEVNIPVNIFAKYSGIFKHSFLYFLTRYIKNSFGLFLLLLIRGLTLKINKVKGLILLERNGIFFFTNYPFWWNNAYTHKATEKFFGTLPEDLGKIYPVFYATWLFSLNPIRICLSRIYLKQFLRNKKMVLIECLLSIREKSKIIHLGYFRWIISVRKFFNLCSNFSYGKFNISRLIYEEVSHSLTQIELFNSILIEDAFSNLTQKYKPKAVIFRIEFQPFEKAIVAGVKDRCTTVSFQHSTFSKNRLSHFFAPGEIPFYLSENNSKWALPLPEYIFTTGRYFQDKMLEMGFSSEKIDVCGPVRYRDLIVYIKGDREKLQKRRELGFSDSEKIFLVAMGWLEQEVISLLASIVKASEGINGRLHLIFRSHPHMGYNKEILRFLKKARPNFKYSFFKKGLSLYDVVFICDGVIQIQTTLGFEAMAIGKVPIVYENRYVYNFNSSEELKGYVPIVCSFKELRDAINLVLNNGKEIENMARRQSKVIDNFFFDIKNDPYKRFTELLNRHGILG